MSLDFEKGGEKAKEKILMFLMFHAAQCEKQLCFIHGGVYNMVCHTQDFMRCIYKQSLTFMKDNFRNELQPPGLVWLA